MAGHALIRDNTTGVIATSDGTVVTPVPDPSAEPDGKVLTTASGVAEWDDATGGGATGPAGGVLSGTYPNPGFAVDMATQAELDAFAATIGGLAPEVPSGTINGSNVTFTLSATPSPSADLLLWKNGLYQLQGTDYTLSGATITMAVAPVTGSTLVAAVPTIGGGGGGGGLELDYVETATSLTVTATSEGSAQTFISGNSVTYDGSTRVKVEVFVAFAVASGGTGVVSLFEDGSTLGWVIEFGDGQNTTLYGSTFITPAAGSHTFTIRAWKTSGTVSLTAKSRATMQELPAWYRITEA